MRAFGRVCSIVIMSCFLFYLGRNGALANEVPSLVSFNVAGPVVTVFDWKAQHCDRSDIPDASARAFRDSAGTLHLFAASNQARAFLGKSLDSLDHTCKVSYEAGHSQSPSAFDDEGWLESFFTLDGRDIVALISMDYHPGRHKLSCGTNKGAVGLCWYSAITLAKSLDGGITFLEDFNKSHVVVPPSDKFSSTSIQPDGAFVPSNIIEVRGSFFVLVSVSKTKDGRGGECLFRSNDIMNASSWEAWDGKAYAIRMESPYDRAESLSQAASGQKLCSPIRSLAAAPVRTLLKISKGGYLSVSLGSLPSNPHVQTVIAQTSEDLINWSQPVQVASLPIYRANGGEKGQVAFYYPSLIDPDSKSLSFDSIDGSVVYLFLTRITYGAGVDRDLVRIPLEVIYHPKS